MHSSLSVGNLPLPLQLGVARTTWASPRAFCGDARAVCRAATPAYAVATTRLAHAQHRYGATVTARHGWVDSGARQDQVPLQLRMTVSADLPATSPVPLPFRPGPVPDAVPQMPAPASATSPRVMAAAARPSPQRLTSLLSKVPRPCAVLSRLLSSPRPGSWTSRWRRRRCYGRMRAR
jgi:hypothetical protein